MRIGHPQDLLQALTAGPVSAGSSDGNKLFAQLLQTMPATADATGADTAMAQTVVAGENAATTAELFANAADAANATIDSAVAVVETAAAEIDAAAETANVSAATVSGSTTIAADAELLEPGMPAAAVASNATPDAKAASTGKQFTPPAVTPVLSPTFVPPASTAAKSAKTMATAATTDAAAPAELPTTAMAAMDTPAAAAAETASTNTDTNSNTADTVNLPDTTAADAATTTASGGIVAPVALPLTVRFRVPAPIASTAAPAQGPALRTKTAATDKPAKPTTANATHAKGGPALPAGGKELPPTATTLFAAPMASPTTADGTSSITVPSFDNAFTGQSTTLALNNSTAQSQWSQNAALGGNAGTDTTRSAALADQTMPPLLNSTYVMGSAGWGEETVQQLRWLKDDDQQSAQLQLHPAELGRLDISIDIKDGQASVQLVAGNAEARELLEKSLPALRELLSQHGMTLADGQVAQHSGQRADGSGQFRSALPFAADDELSLIEAAVRPAFRQSSNQHRIDYYV